jgi:hypothetical protein
MHDDLLDLAEHLARREAGRPKQASLRRAIATAYYALFHALAFLCADALVGWSRPWDAVTPVYRSLDHANTKRVFERDRDGTLFGTDVATIGRISIALQQGRYSAHYNPQPLSLSRGETIELIERARTALRFLHAIPLETRILLAAHLVGRHR